MSCQGDGQGPFHCLIWEIKARLYLAESGREKAICLANCCCMKSKRKLMHFNLEMKCQPQ